MKRFVKLTKEYKDLEKLTKVTSKYKQMLRDIEEAKSVLETETDADMRELAKEDLDANTAALPAIEEEIKLLLIPEDPEDYKNVILEIRAGAGGEEAAVSPPAPMTQSEQEEVRKLGIGYGEEILAGFQSGNYEATVRHFPEELKQRLTGKVFSETCKGLGRIVRYEFLTELQTPLINSYLWKVTVERAAQSEKHAGKVITGDLLFSLRIIKKDGRYQIAACGFN